MSKSSDESNEPHRRVELLTRVSVGAFADAPGWTLSFAGDMKAIIAKREPADGDVACAGRSAH